MSLPAVSRPPPTVSSPSACTICHRRKLRCDKVLAGCKNCAKAHAECIYPPADSRSGKKRGPYCKEKAKREQELKEKITTLETKFEQLASHFEAQGISLTSLESCSSPQDVRGSNARGAKTQSVLYQDQENPLERRGSKFRFSDEIGSYEAWEEANTDSASSEQHPVPRQSLWSRSDTKVNNKLKAIKAND